MQTNVRTIKLFTQPQQKRFVLQMLFCPAHHSTHISLPSGTNVSMQSTSIQHSISIPGRRNNCKLYCSLLITSLFVQQTLTFTATKAAAEDEWLSQQHLNTDFGLTFFFSFQQLPKLSFVNFSFSPCNQSLNTTCKNVFAHFPPSISCLHGQGRRAEHYSFDSIASVFLPSSFDFYVLL
jgi:hypothetical protein